MHGGGGVVSQQALQVVSQHALQQVSRGVASPRQQTVADGMHPTGMHSCYCPQGNIFAPVILFTGGGGQVHPPDQGDTGNKRAVRILLERILVMNLVFDKGHQNFIQAI